MYCFAKICCLCLQQNEEFNKLEEADSHGVTFFDKLLVLIPQFETLVQKTIPNYICKKCRRYLNKFYKFQFHCLKSYKLLQSYIRQLDTTNINLIEDDLILIKEDMEECLKNMEIYIKVEDDNKEQVMEASSAESTPSPSPDPNANANPNPNPVEATSSRKRTRECKKVSYNEDYDSDTIFSDSEVYLTKSAKRKKNSDCGGPKGEKTVVIPQNNIFAKDLTKIINDIITQLAAEKCEKSDKSENNAKPTEVKVKFKNSSGNTEQLLIYQDEDTVEVKFSKEGKMGYLKVCRQGGSMILTHNMSESSGQGTPEEEPAPKDASPGVWNCTICHKSFQSCYTLTKHVNNYMNFDSISCNICDKVFEHVTDLKRHIHEHATTRAPEPAPAPLEDVEEKPVVETETKTPTSPKTSQYCEMKVVLSELQENLIKSERSSSPEFQFHLSDDSDDEFDRDTIILGTVGNEDDFADTRTPSPVELGAKVMEFLEEKEEFLDSNIKESSPKNIVLPKDTNEKDAENLQNSSVPQVTESLEERKKGTAPSELRLPNGTNEKGAEVMESLEERKEGAKPSQLPPNPKNIKEKELKGTENPTQLLGSQLLEKKEDTTPSQLSSKPKNMKKKEKGTKVIESLEERKESSTPSPKNIKDVEESQLFPKPKNMKEKVKEKGAENPTQLLGSQPIESLEEKKEGTTPSQLPSNSKNIKEKKKGTENHTELLGSQLMEKKEGTTSSQLSPKLKNMKKKEKGAKVIESLEERKESTTPSPKNTKDVEESVARTPNPEKENMIKEAEAKSKSNGTAEPKTNGELFEERLLKIVVNKAEVDEFMRNKKQLSTSAIRSSPRRLSYACKIVERICPHCKDSFKTQKKLETHLEKSHQIFTHNLED